MSGYVRTEQCTHAERCMQAYVDRTLSADEVRVVEEHLAGCTCCAKCYRLEEGVRVIVRKACDEPCPESVRDSLRRICDDCDCED